MMIDPEKYCICYSNFSLGQYILQKRQILSMLVRPWWRCAVSVPSNENLKSSYQRYLCFQAFAKEDWTHAVYCMDASKAPDSLHLYCYVWSRRICPSLKDAVTASVF